MNSEFAAQFGGKVTDCNGGLILWVYVLPLFRVVLGLHVIVNTKGCSVDTSHWPSATFSAWGNI